MSVPTVAPLEAARRARWFREYAARPEATDAERAERLARAAEYQALAVTDYCADRHDASEGVDS